MTDESRTSEAARARALSRLQIARELSLRVTTPVAVLPPARVRPYTLNVRTPGYGRLRGERRLATERDLSHANQHRRGESPTVRPSRRK